MRFWYYAKKQRFCRELANTRLTKELKAFFALAESLPTSATLMMGHCYDNDMTYGMTIHYDVEVDFFIENDNLLFELFFLKTCVWTFNRACCAVWIP